VPMSVRLTGGALEIGGQDCHFADHGAFTGDVSAAMLLDCGASSVLLGHSERRAAHGETSDIIAQKIEAALVQNLDIMLCVGETKAERDDKKAEQVVIDQLQASIPEHALPKCLMIAYEPVWAIGSGRTPTVEDVAAMHRHMRLEIAGLVAASRDVRLLYGGSVKPANAAALLAAEDVNGALVGGASLAADDFLAIAAAV